MKKTIICGILVVGVVAIVLIAKFSIKSNSEHEIDNSNSTIVENYENGNEEIDNQEKGNQEVENQEKDGYEIIVSKKNITLEKGTETSFDITFTNPDESSIREYITCKDQSDIIEVRYGMLEDRKITVEVEGLKVGVTEIVLCDFSYPDRKEIVKVNVTDDASDGILTKEMVYEGVNNYCHSEYDWSAAEDNPSMMYVKMGEESETEYQVIFRSYTGAFVYFYVNKSDGTTRIVEEVPNLNVESEVGTIDLYKYLKNND